MRAVLAPLNEHRHILFSLQSEANNETQGICSVAAQLNKQHANSEPKKLLIILYS